MPFCLLLVFATWNTLAPAQQTFLSKTRATKLFPRNLAGYQLKDVKVKSKSTVWKEYSATFKPSKKGKELKIVVNDVLPDGTNEWATQFKSAEDLISGYPVREVRDGNKSSVLVLVNERTRVDFKSREVSPEKIRAMAEAFNFEPVRAISRR